MWGRPSSDCSRKCSRILAATRATISCPVSNAFGYALVAALGNVVGALAVTRRAARELALIEHFVAFGAGFMLPEAFARSGTAAPALVLAGYLAVHFTQHTLTPHFHFGEETHAVNRVAGTSALVGLLLHTFFDGVAIASAFLVRPALGLMVFIAIFLHKLPEGVTVSSLMMAGGRSGGQAIGAAAMLGAATRAGVVRWRHDLRRSVEPGAGVSGEAGVEAAGGVFCGSSDILCHEDRTGSGLVVGKRETGNGKRERLRCPTLRNKLTTKEITLVHRVIAFAVASCSARSRRRTRSR